LSPVSIRNGADDDESEANEEMFFEVLKQLNTFKNIQGF